MKKAAKLCAFVLAGVITFGGLTACTEQNNDVVNNITLSISTTKNEIKVGETLEISVETNGDKTKVVFNSSDTSVCSVTDGVITGLKEGTAQISATLDNVTSNIINIKVTKDNEDPDVITLSISTTKTEINVNETLEVVSTTNGDTSKIIYSSSNTSVASISTSGVITGLKAGTTDISATLGNVKSNTITITVKEGTIISDTPEYLQGGFKLNDYSFTKDENFTIEDFINAIEEVLVALYSDNENIKYLLDENNNLLPSITSNEQFIDYFNLFYSKRGQEQISISQQLGNYGTTFFSASRQSYWNTSRSDQQISFGLNVPFGDITTSLNYSYSNNIWQNDRDHLLAFTLNVPFSHWMRTDSQSAFRNSNASYSMSNDLKGGMTNLSGVYGTLLPDNNLNYSVQVGNTHGGNTSSGTSGYSSLNYRGAYGNTNVGYSRNGDSSQIYYGMSGGIIAHADGITFGQPLGDTMVLVKAPGADNVKIENQTGIHTDWRGYAILPFATEYRENRVALNANSLADNVELNETVVTVIPTHGAIARATFNAQIGGKVLMTLKYGNKSVPFGAIVTHGENKNGSIVAENGQVYLTGLPQSGKLQVSWGNDKNSNCIVDYKLPEVSPGTLLNQQTAICR